jgi:hypothetical protein
LSKRVILYVIPRVQPPATLSLQMWNMYGDNIATYRVLVSVRVVDAAGRESVVDSHHFVDGAETVAEAEAEARAQAELAGAEVVAVVAVRYRQRRAAD